MATKPKAAAPAAAPKVQTKKELSANNYVAVVAAIVVVIIVVTVIVGKILVGSILLNSKVVSGKLKANHDLDTKLAAAPKLIDAYNQLGGRQSLIDHALPTTEDFPQLVSIMEAIANASGTDLTTVSPSVTASSTVTTGTTSAAGSSTGSAQPYSFSAETTGQYTQIVAFLKNIELSARPMWVPSIEFRGDDSNLKASMQLTTYYEPAFDVKDKTETVK